MKDGGLRQDYILLANFLFPSHVKYSLEFVIGEILKNQKKLLLVVKRKVQE